MKTLLTLALCAATCHAVAADLRYDRNIAVQDAIGRQLEGPTRQCMRSVAIQRLMAGVRDSQQIQTAQVQMCGGPMLAMLGDSKDVRFFLGVLGSLELAAVPGVR